MKKNDKNTSNQLYEIETHIQYLKKSLEYFRGLL